MQTSFVPLILLLILQATRSTSDDKNSTEVRKGRVNGRIVKIYSGVKPDPVLCEEEGFKADPIDCSVFYRCTKESRGKYTIFRFRCGPGTVYDPDTEVCNHPSNTKRSECGGKIQTLINVDNDNDIEGDELPSPISTASSMYPSQSESRNFTEFPSTPQFMDKYSDNKPTTTYSYPFLTTTKPIITVESNSSPSYQWIDSQSQVQTVTNTKKSFPCSSEGFVGDSDDCRKFYRCVSDSRGGFVQYEFSCSESTVWDENMQSCNHAWAVRSKRCGQNDYLSNSSNNKFDKTQNSSLQDASGTTINGYQNNEDNDIYDNNSSEYGNKFNNKSQSSSSSQKEPDTGKLHENQENHVSTPLEQYIENDELSHYDTTSSAYPPNNLLQNHVSPGSGNNRGNNVCTQSGFMADSVDCQKFYRCVDNGNGGFTKYEFSCSQQTVWDNTIEACNHAWAVKECGNKLQPETSTALSSSRSPTSVITSISSYITEEIENGYMNQVSQEHKLTTSSTILTTVSLLATTESSKMEVSQCSSSGFFGDSYDCQKFYRCVEDNKGSFTKYDYKCGEGTLWDGNIESCNHAWAVTSCNQNLRNNTTSKPLLNNPTKLTTTSSSETSANENYQNYDSDSNYNYQPSATTTSADNNVSKTTLKYQQSECQSSGFIGDSSNCKIFYRCVDNGTGGFTRHEFTCGDGTVWDSNIEACNHEEAVKECGVSNMQTTLHVNVVSLMTSEIPGHEGEKVTHSNITPDDFIRTTTMRSSTITTQSTSTSNQNECNANGFKGDKNDCKKFYRCVDNGNGSFTQHEFSCGQGTAWDSKIEACNHEWAVENCSKTAEIQIESSVQLENNTQMIVTTASPSSQTQQTQVSTETQVSQVNFVKNDCSSEGFYANPNDCKKFFRCVNDGKGGYTKYDFICGDGTVWIQEIQSCDHDTDINCNYTESTTSTVNYKNNTTTVNSITSSIEIEHATHKTDVQECVSEGFYPNLNDCRNFFRCVDNGNGYTKYEFSCSEGTAWDVTTESCNYLSKVNSCKDIQTKPTIQDEEVSESVQVATTEKTSKATSVDSTSKPTMSSEIFSESTNSIETTSKSNELMETTLKPTTTKATTTTSPTENRDPAAENTCQQDGYYGNTKDCTKFYRCVGSENGHYTKYDYSCGEGTIWDQDITACNHPQDVTNPSCQQENSSTTTSSSTQDTSNQNGNSLETTLSPTSTSTSPPNKNETNSGCSNNETSTESSSINNNITCENAGFYANPNDCKKFYRCVDWDGNGEKFSIFNFECGDGTIWDPALETCNHKDSVYPPRNCNGTQQHNENMAESSSTTEKISSTSDDNTTTTKQTTPNQPTTQQTTTQKTTRETTTQVTTTQKTTTQETITQPTTTEQSTTQKTTTQATQSTTQLSTTQEPTTQESTTQQATTSQESTTDKSTTQQSTESIPTTAQTTQEPTTKSSTEQSTHTESTESSTASSTTDSTTDSTTQQLTTADNISSTESSTTEVTGSNGTTTENQTESSTESNTSNDKCPHTDNDQHLFVCPTSFKRHPKYCNLFYQCTEDNDSYEVKIAVFQCPNNTIYDESKVQCVEESKSNKKCEGQTAKKHRVKRLGLVNNEPIIVTNKSMSCPSYGHFPFETQEQCSAALLKCELTKSGNLRGIVHRCPEGYIYWSISRRCEPLKKLIDCQRTSDTWSRRYDIPVERENVGK